AHSYPAATSSIVGNSGSSTLVSCRHTTSGSWRRIMARTRGSRCLIELTFQVTSRTGGSLVLPDNPIGDRSRLADAIGDAGPPVGAASDVETRRQGRVDRTEQVHITHRVLRQRARPANEGRALRFDRQPVDSRERVVRGREDVVVGTVE